MQTNAWLVQHIEHARKPAANLRRKPDALALSATERARCPVEIEVIKPDIVEKAKPFVDLLEDRFGNLLLLRTELLLQTAEPVERINNAAPR